MVVKKPQWKNDCDSFWQYFLLVIVMDLNNVMI